MSASHRLRTIIAGYASAVVAATIAGVLPFLPTLPLLLMQRGLLGLLLVPLVGLAIAVIALPPTAALIWYAERRGIRSVGAYAMAGAGIGVMVAHAVFIAGAIAWPEIGSTPWSPSVLIMLSGWFAACGAVGGWVYGRGAGRDAGACAA